MARKKPAKKAKKAPARRAAKRTATPRKAARPAKKAARKKARASVRASGKSKPPARKAPKKAAKKVTAKAASARASAPAKRPNLDRPRKTVADIPGIPSSLNPARSSSSAARSGYEEMKDKIRKHTGTGPALTSGDVDADWESAETVGDEAPGGDNPTPDQDVVDDIGRALGVEYEDDEELQGGAEITDRDRKRWELDPASKDDFDEEE